jgi:hypothetical protein
MIDAKTAREIAEAQKEKLMVKDFSYFREVVEPDIDALIRMNASLGGHCARYTCSKNGGLDVNLENIRSLIRSRYENAGHKVVITYSSNAVFECKISW